jgi:hypothetical protein
LLEKAIGVEKAIEVGIISCPTVEGASGQLEPRRVEADALKTG